MLPRHLKIPGRLLWVLVGIYCGYQCLALLRDILAPLAFALLLASATLPVVHRLQRVNVRGVLAVAISIIFVLVLLGGLFTLFISQAENFSDDYPIISQRLNAVYTDVTAMAAERLQLNAAEQNKFMSDKLEQLLGYLFGYASITISTITSLLLMAVLVPLYTFFILHYRQQIVKAVLVAFHSVDKVYILNILGRMRWITGQYIKGVLTVMLIVGTLHTLLLYIMGVPHSFFLGTMSAVLNLIPYVGVAIAAGFTATYGGLMLGSPFYFVLILIQYLLIAALDANFITPRIVGSKISLNALAAIFAVLLGGNVWGVQGMILALPILGAFKVIAEHVPGWQALAVLVGDGSNGAIDAAPRAESDAGATA